MLATVMIELTDDASLIFPVGMGAGPHNMDYPPKTMTRITSDCGATRFLGIKWP